ncbi:MAG: hypothetical protein WC839_01780 [Candidatus Paceibacterota bacterium]
MRNNQKDIQIVINKGKLIKKLNSNSRGIHNEASLYRWHSKYYVVRKVGKQYNLSTQQLITLEKNLHVFYNLLKKHLRVIGLPKIFLTEINIKQNTILLITEYFPKGKVVEIKTTTQKVKYFKAISKSIIELTSSRRNLYLNQLICSIDPNPDNFFIDSRGKLIYNDFTPPLYRKDGKWFEFRRKDEIHAKKSDKEKRYFTGFNLLLIFINKIRIYLSFSDYLKFIQWLFNEIDKLHLLQQNPVTVFPKIYKEISSGKVLDFQEFEQYATLRDILRFNLSFNKDLTSLQISKIYKKSKKLDGINVLIKKLYGKNKNSYSRGR